MRETLVFLDRFSQSGCSCRVASPRKPVFKSFPKHNPTIRPTGLGGTTDQQGKFPMIPKPDMNDCRSL